MMLPVWTESVIVEIGIESEWTRTVNRISKFEEFSSGFEGFLFVLWILGISYGACGFVNSKVGGFDDNQCNLFIYCWTVGFRGLAIWEFSIEICQPKEWTRSLFDCKCFKD
jgi:hypothetical protein